jgi:ubiquinone/menaquinone biosynthesis C-methylase UbiE
MPQAKGYVDAEYLAIAGSMMVPTKERSYELMRLQPGSRVLDLGCGPGTDTLRLGEIVGAAGEVHGADHDASMVARANQRAEAAGLGCRVTHRQADAGALPWPDGTFDASRSERMFQHLLDPERAFSELVRVTRPGGWVVVLDGDWSTFTIESDEIEIERRLVRFHAEHMVNNPYSGRRLSRMFRSRGLRDISIDVWPVLITDYALARRIARLDQIEREALAAGVIDEAQAGRWRASLERAASIDGFFASTNGVTVAGRKAD